MSGPRRPSRTVRRFTAVPVLLLAHFLATAGCGPEHRASDHVPQESRKPDMVLLVVDDMLFDTPGAFGGTVPGLTPRMDELARRGMRFTRAYNASSRCAPSRGSMMTGLYQDQYAARPGTADVNVREGVPILPRVLASAGYHTALLGKDTHYRPLDAYAFREVVPMADMAVGRSPEAYARNVAGVVRRARAAGRPFFLSINTHDPHRPFAGAPGELEALRSRHEQEIRNRPDSSRPEFQLPPAVTAFSDAGHPPPDLVPEHPLADREYGTYLNSVHRADAFVGAVLDTLERLDVLDGTLLVFLSDNGIHWPFAKSNVYEASVRTPVVVHWPGRTRAGAHSDELVSTVDLMPTFLDAIGRLQDYDGPGRSLIPLLDDPAAPHARSHVFASINGKAKDPFPMRSISDGRFHYIWNPWSDGEHRFYDGRYSGGLALEGFEEAAARNAAAAERLEFFYTRVPEELYRVDLDPYSSDNLIHEQAYADILDALRQEMARTLRANRDPFLDAYLMSTIDRDASRPSTTSR